MATPANRPSSSSASTAGSPDCTKVILSCSSGSERPIRSKRSSIKQPRGVESLIIQAAVAVSNGVEIITVPWATAISWILLSIASPPVIIKIRAPLSMAERWIEGRSPVIISSVAGSYPSMRSLNDSSVIAPMNRWRCNSSLSSAPVIMLPCKVEQSDVMVASTPRRRSEPATRYFSDNFSRETTPHGFPFSSTIGRIRIP